MPTISTIGYFIEVDLEYPARIHDQQRLSPCAREGNSVRCLAKRIPNRHKRAVQNTPGKGFQIAADNV